MFLKGGRIPLRSFAKFSSISHCDDEDADNTSDRDMSLIEQADAAIENSKAKIKPPMTFEDVGRACQAGGVDSYDGIRIIYQKQLNLNVVANHFWWLGSQNLQKGSMYNYRLILNEDDKMFSAGDSLVSVYAEDLR